MKHFILLIVALFATLTITAQSWYTPDDFRKLGNKYTISYITPGFDFSVEYKDNCEVYTVESTSMEYLMGGGDSFSPAFINFTVLGNRRFTLPANLINGKLVIENNKEKFYEIKLSEYLKDYDGGDDNIIIEVISSLGYIYKLAIPYGFVEDINNAEK